MKPVCCFVRHDTEMKVSFSCSFQFLQWAGTERVIALCLLLSCRNGWMACLAALKFYCAGRKESKLAVVCIPHRWLYWSAGEQWQRAQEFIRDLKEQWALVKKLLLSLRSGEKTAADQSFINTQWFSSWIILILSGLRGRIKQWTNEHISNTWLEVIRDYNTSQADDKNIMRALALLLLGHYIIYENHAKSQRI